MSDAKPAELIEEVLVRLEEYVRINKVLKSPEVDTAKDFQLLKSLMLKHRNSIMEGTNRGFQTRERKLKRAIESMKPNIPLSPDEKKKFRDQVIKILKVIENKISALGEKKDAKKESKKRQHDLEYFKFHQAKLQQLADWLTSGSRTFSQELRNRLCDQLEHLHISHEDQVYQSQIKELYEKIFQAAEVRAETTLDLLRLSCMNRPQLNDAMPTKQEKQHIIPTSGIYPSYPMIDVSVMPKMTFDTLIMIFYLQRGEADQFLAARALMDKGWRFSRRKLIWIKRQGAPFDVTPDGEKGNFIHMGSDLYLRQNKEMKIKYAEYLVDL